MNSKSSIRALVIELEAGGELFESISDAPWITAVEEKLGRKLPPALRYLVMNFSFASFDIGGVTVFSNLNDRSPLDITVAPFSDKCMSSLLITRGYLQFGRPDSGSYDPVCFDCSKGNYEPPVVVVDHEDILLERKKVRLRKLAHSFVELVESGLHRKSGQK